MSIAAQNIELVELTNSKLAIQIVTAAAHQNGFAREWEIWQRVFRFDCVPGTIGPTARGNLAFEYVDSWLVAADTKLTHLPEFY